MAIKGTEKTLTVDANAVNYYFIFHKGKQLPEGLPVTMIKIFHDCVIKNHPIAINKFIREDYERVLDYELIKNWLKMRSQCGLAIKVECSSLPREIKNCLRDSYGFDCYSRDERYLETCLNTFFKLLVTENREHFLRPLTRKRQSMPIYLKRKLGIRICTIDQCCERLLDNQGSV